MTELELVPYRRRLRIMLPWVLPMLVTNGVFLIALNAKWRLPGWIYVVLMVSSVLPIIGTLMVGREVKRKEAELKAGGRCLNCGYDLRASPDRCPECGRPKRVL